MEFYPNPFILINSKCGDPSCGMLHPYIIEANFAAVIFDDAPGRCLVVIMQQKFKGETEENPIWVATIMPPHSIGFEDEDDGRLYVVLDEGKYDALAQDHEDLETLQNMIRGSAGHLITHFFGQADGGDDEVEVTGLDGLDPSKMFRA